MPRRPFWTDLVIWLDWHLNHPYWHAYRGFPDSHWGPLSERACVIADWLTNNWAHD